MRCCTSKGEYILKTAITDKTLSYLRYDTEKVSADLLRAYARTVFSCGADYIELSSETAINMELEDYSENYILHISSSYDIGYCTAKRFAYVVVPLYLAGNIDSIPDDQPVILEVNVDEYCAHAMLLYLHRFSFIRRISAIRLTGIFGDTDDSVAKLIAWSRANLFLPLDICPLNTMMTGVSDAISARTAGAAMITLSFGRGYYYTSLEQYIIDLHITQRNIMSNDTIKGICVASFVFADIFCTIPTGLARIIDTDSEVTAAICDIENGKLYRPFRSSRASRSLPRESAIDRKIKSIGLEHDIETAIIDMLKKVNFSFYKEITKRNMID